MAEVLRLNETLARQLGIAILSGFYAPGARFDGEIGAAEAMGVSRTAYREALRTLTAKGMLISKPKSGTQVAPRSSWNLLDPDVLAWMFSSSPDERFVRALFELREMIEPGAAALAAKRRTDSDIRAMKDALVTMAEYGIGSAQGQEADRQFHGTLLSATDNEALISLASSVGAAVQWTTHFKHRASNVPRDPVPQHVAVFEAIAAGDPEAAARVMRNLLRIAFEDMAPVMLA